MIKIGFFPKEQNIEILPQHIRHLLNENHRKNITNKYYLTFDFTFVDRLLIFYLFRASILFKGIVDYSIPLKQ